MGKLKIIGKFGKKNGKTKKKNIEEKFNCLYVLINLKYLGNDYQKKFLGLLGFLGYVGF